MSYAQFGQTDWVLGKHPGPGFFVEAGAANGVLNSNTKLLEERGWQGICVEPSREYQRLVENRRCRTDPRCLWRADGQTVDFEEVPWLFESFQLSRVRSEHFAEGAKPFIDPGTPPPDVIRAVPTVSLTTLLREHAAPQVVTYLSLDTEGSEFEILAAHDFTQYQFALITIEHNYIEPTRSLIRDFLGHRGYVQERAQDSIVDDWYVNARFL